MAQTDHTAPIMVASATVDTSSRMPRTRLDALVGSIAAFVFVFFVHLFIIKQYSVNAPFWDEWPSLLSMLNNYQGGTLTVTDLLAQHNEHRILISRLIFLGLFKLFGEMNLTSYMLFSGLLYAICVALWVYGIQRIGISVWIALASACIVVSPTQYENMLWGFQIAFYVLILSTIVSICTVSVAACITWKWLWLIIFACFCSTFSIASGLFIWAIIFVCLFLRFWFDHGSLRAILRDRTTMAKLMVFSLMALAAAVLYLYDYHAPLVNDQMRAKTLGDYLKWISLAISFPILEQISVTGIGTAIAQWGIILFGIYTYARAAFRTQDRLSQKKLILFTGIVLFIVLNAAIMGYSRGSMPFIALRYGTIFLWGAGSAVVIGGDIVHRFRLVKGLAGFIPLFVSISLAFLLFLHFEHWISTFPSMQIVKNGRQVQAESIVSYLRNQAPDRTIPDPLPYPDLTLLRSQLDNPAIVALLPSWIQAQAHVVGPDITTPTWKVGAYFPIPELQSRPYAVGSWSGDNTHTGQIIVPLPIIAQPILAIPVAGYPTRGHSQLAVEILGVPSFRAVYQSPDPTEHWQTWFVDVSGYQGRQARIIATDADPETWFAFDMPYRMSWAAWLMDRLLANSDVGLGCLSIGTFVLWRVLVEQSSDQRRTRRLGVVGMVGVVAISGFLILTHGPSTFTPGSAFTFYSIRVVDVLPDQFQATVPLHVLPNGLFMHADGQLATKPLVLPAGMCAVSQVLIDPQAPVDSAADGVDFSLDALVNGQRVGHISVTVQPGHPETIRLPVPSQVSFSLRLATHQRTNPTYDWAIWQEPHVELCQ